MTERAKRASEVAKESESEDSFFSVERGDEVRGLGRTWAVERVIPEADRLLLLTDGLVVTETVNLREWIENGFEKGGR